VAYATLSTYDEVLKLFYTEGIQDQLNNDTVLASFLERNERDISGKDAKIQCHYGRNAGVGSRADAGALPTSTYQLYKMATVPMKYHYGTVKFTGPTIAATRDNRGAYTQVMDTEIRGLVNDVKKEQNRQMWGCGYGVLGRWLTGAAASQTCQKAYRSNAACGDGFGSTFGAKYMTEGRTVSMAVVASASSSAFKKLTIDADALTVAITKGSVSDTIVLSANPTVTELAGTYYCRPASIVTITSASAAGAARLEMMGLRGIVTADETLDDLTLFNAGTDVGCFDDDDLQGLAHGTYAMWNAQVRTHASGRYAGQRALEFNHMQQVFDDVEEAAGVSVGPNLILTTRAIRREYLELCRAERRTVNTMQLDGGWTGLDYNGVPLVVDNDAIDGEIYFLTTADIQVYQMADWNWMQKDGAILHRTSGYDIYEAALFKYAEMGCTHRNTQGVLCDINYTV